jgi:hypothetical protein
MAEVVREIDEPVLLNDVPYHAQVCGRANGHIWEGWLEFVADDGSDVRRTPRETTQPDRNALVYWAEGLSGTYLEGAMARTLTRLEVTERTLPSAYFEGPEDSPHVERTNHRAAPEVDRAVLDPFSVGAKGEDLLRRELGALRAWHLRNIVRAYDLAEPSLDVEALDEPELVELIVGAVLPA